MTNVLHVIDASCDETQLGVLELLRLRRSSEGEHHEVCSIDGPMAARAGPHVGTPVLHAERRLSTGLNYAPGLRRVVEQAAAEFIHAWGIEAAVAAASLELDIPIIITLLEPAATIDIARWLRVLPRHLPVAAGSQVIRARLASAGESPQNVVVIRGPVDFAAIKRARESGIRQQVAGDSRSIVLMHGPASRGGGQYYGLWAAAVVRQVIPGLKVILPYDSPETQRLRRFVSGIGMASMLIEPGGDLNWCELAACADVLLVPAVDEVCTEPIAAAMAAGVVVVGSAVRSVTEIIADHHNGLLAKPAEPRALAAKLLTAIEDADLRRKLTEVARGQAYEVFGVCAFIDNYSRLYDNVRAGRPAADEIRDTAMVG